MSVRSYLLVATKLIYFRTTLGAVVVDIVWLKGDLLWCASLLNVCQMWLRCVYLFTCKIWQRTALVGVPWLITECSLLFQDSPMRLLDSDVLWVKIVDITFRHFELSEMDGWLFSFCNSLQVDAKISRILLSNRPVWVFSLWISVQRAIKTFVEVFLVC